MFKLNLWWWPQGRDSLKKRKNLHCIERTRTVYPHALSMVKKVMTLFCQQKPPGKIVEITRPFREILVQRKGSEAQKGVIWKKVEKGFPQTIELGSILWWSTWSNVLVFCQGRLVQESYIHTCFTEVIAPDLSPDVTKRLLREHFTKEQVKTTAWLSRRTVD